MTKRKTKTKTKTVYQRKGLPAEQAPSWPYPDSNKMLIIFF